jgi:hypothetical protein
MASRAKYMASDGRLLLGGYPVVDPLRNPHSDKDDLIYAGERNYDDPLVKDALEGVHKHRTDGSLTANKASKYVRRILHALNKELISQGGVKLRYRDLDIGEMEHRETEMRDSRGRLLGYVLGYYNTETKKLRLNPYLTEEMLKKVTIHEIFHYAQHKLGIIGKYVENFGPFARPVIESQTDDMVDMLMPQLSEATEPLPERYQTSLN